MSGRGGDRSAQAAANGSRMGRPTNASKLAPNKSGSYGEAFSNLFAKRAAPTPSSATLPTEPGPTGAEASPSTFGDLEG